MIRTDKLHQWAPTQMAGIEPGQVVTDDEFEHIEAAHAATEMGAEDEAEQMERFPGFGVVAVPCVVLAVVALVHLFGWAFK